MIRWLWRGPVIVMVAAASLFAVGTRASATQLLCENAQALFITCPVGTTPPATSQVPGSSAPPPTSPTRNTTAPASHPVPLTTPATAQVPRTLTPVIEPVQSKATNKARSPLLLTVDVLLLIAASVGLAFWLVDRRRSFATTVSVADPVTLLAIGVGALVGWLLLIAGLSRNSPGMLYGSLACAGIAVLLLTRYKQSYRLGPGSQTERAVPVAPPPMSAPGPAPAPMPAPRPAPMPVPRPAPMPAPAPRARAHSRATPRARAHARARAVVCDRA